MSNEKALEAKVVRLEKENSDLIKEFKRLMPSPTNKEIDSQIFKDIYKLMKDWDINVPEYYDGYCSCNGSHIKLILEVLNNIRCDCSNPRPEEPTASEALYGFMGWLTTREGTLKVGGSHNCAIIAELIDEYCKKHNISEPREGWGKA